MTKKRPTLRRVTFTAEEAETLLTVLLRMGAFRRDLGDKVMTEAEENILVKVLPRLTHGGKPNE